jgi:hypothetical protein
MAKEEVEEMKKGYTCSECDNYNAYPTYVFAHWDEDLHHTCECGTINVILQGEVINTNTKFKRKTPIFSTKQ